MIPKRLLCQLPRRQSCALQIRPGLCGDDRYFLAHRSRNCAIATSSPLMLQWVNTRAESGKISAARSARTRGLGLSARRNHTPALLSTHRHSRRPATRQTTRRKIDRVRGNQMSVALGRIPGSFARVDPRSGAGFFAVIFLREQRSAVEESQDLTEGTSFHLPGQHRWLGRLHRRGYIRSAPESKSH